MYPPTPCWYFRLMEEFPSNPGKRLLGSKLRVNKQLGSRLLSGFPIWNCFHSFVKNIYPVILHGRFVVNDLKIICLQKVFLEVLLKLRSYV